MNNVGIPIGDEGLVGRERELERISAVLSDSARMVTLVGPGGIGKTRLASAVTAGLRRSGHPPVPWVHLAKLPQHATACAVEEEMVTAIHDGDFSSRSGVQALVDKLRRTDAAGRVLPTILVLDNCEHVLDGVGQVIAELLAAIPGLIILATSRTAIGWVEEQIVTIPPLARDQAVALFRQRAELTGRPIPAADAGLVEQICQHLHFYPFHIRLAAARLRYQPLPAILSDLDGETLDDRRLRWSPAFRAGLDERHRDIGTVIGWSYELCGPKERLLFERLSVFAAGYDIHPDDAETDRETVIFDIGADLETIQIVCAGADLDGLVAHEIEALLEQLVDRSLVLLHVGPEIVRYSLLESFRMFAHDRLRERSEAEHRLLAARHRHHYREYVAVLCTGWVTSDEQELLARARAEWDNIATAISSSTFDPDEVVIGAEMAVDLIASRLPFLRGSLREFRRLAERSLAAALEHGRCPTELEISTHAWIGWLSVCQGLPDEAEMLLARCIDACLGAAAHADWRANPTVDLGLPPEVDYLWGSKLLLADGDPAAIALLARARTKFTAAGHLGGVGMAGLFEALAACFYGTPDQALRVTGEHLAGTAAAGAQWATSHAQFARAIALSEHGNPTEAVALCNAGLAQQIPMRDQWCCVWGIHIRSWALAELISSSGTDSVTDHVVRWASDIAQVSGSIEPVRRQIGLDIVNLKPFAARTRHAIDIARKVLGDKAFDAMARRGEQMPTVVVLADSLVAPQKLPTGWPSTELEHPVWRELTGAEQEVAVLAATGLTNAMIATRRGTSTRTVDGQLASVLSKFAINSRRDILALLPSAERERATRESRRRASQLR
ncbi:AAA family ATPase [Nocardia sp. NPDC004604]|uniref:ATP-binding protein n=1 Tax=Nocardia sp. NPDC004604 TaxID=3157013 RepID=UPI0033BB98CE